MPAILPDPMYKRILFLIIGLSILSCQKSENEYYAEKLNDCLTESDIVALNNATIFVEELLAAHYGDSNANNNFYAFTTDLSSIQSMSQFEEDFFINEFSIQLLHELEKAGTFDKIWSIDKQIYEDEEDIIIVSPENVESRQDEISVYNLNPEGEYLKCINKNYQNQDVKDILNSISEIGDVAPSITAVALNQALTKSDYDNDLNKVIVSIECYFNIVNLIEKNSGY